MRRHPLHQLLPGSFELWYITIVSAVLILAGNGRLILEQMGIVGSTRLISAQVSTRVDWGLGILQSFRFSANAVNLVVWGVVGLIIYSVLESIVQGLRTLQFERDFNSSLYIHPQGYTSAGFWREVTTSALLGFLLLACMIAGGILYVVVAIPTGFTLVQQFIVHSGFRTALDPVAGLAVIFAATTVMYLLIKLVVRHHRIAQYVE